MASTLQLKKLSYIIFFLIASCIVTGVNRYIAAGDITPDQFIICEITFALYFAFTLGLLNLSVNKLNAYVILFIIFLPFGLLTLNGLLTNWEYFYPYHFPRQTLIVLAAQILAYKMFNQPAIKKAAAFLVAGIALYVICFFSFNNSGYDLTKNKDKSASNYLTKKNVIKDIGGQLIDTNARKLILSDRKYYIFNFSYYSSAPCQVKLEYLKGFARQLPPNVQIVYVANSQLETFDVFKSKLKPDTSDKIIYAYLYDKAFLKKLAIDKYPSEIMVGPGFDVLREQRGFYEFDANNYAQATLQLVKK